MHGADHGEPVLRLGVADRVPAREQRARRPDLRVGGGEDLRQHLDRQLLREGGDRERQQRRSAHREHVVERVRRRDRPVVGGVVDDRREEIQGEDDRAVVVEAIDRRVVRRGEADEEILGVHGHEPFQELLQPRGRILRGATAARCQVGQPDAARVELHEAPPPGRVRET
jgi:hypothetical protein